jgi:hypothetical protein
MKIFLLVIVPLFMSVAAHARDLTFLRSQFPAKGICFFTFKGPDALDEMYLQVLGKTARRFNPGWHPQTPLESSDVYDVNGDAYDLDLYFYHDWVPASRDLFYEVQNELIRRKADPKDFPGEALALAVASIYKQIGHRADGSLIASMLIALLKDGGTLGGVIDLSNYHLQDLSAPWYYALKNSARFEQDPTGGKPGVRRPEPQYVYAVSPEGIRAARDVVAQGFTGDLSAAGIAKILRLKLTRLESRKSLTELVNGIFRLYGALAHLRLVGDVSVADLRAALKSTEPQLKTLMAQAEPTIQILADYNRNPSALSRGTRWTNPEAPLVRETFSTIDKRLSYVRHFLVDFGSTTGGSSISHLY